MTFHSTDAAFQAVFAERFPALFRYLDRLSGDPALASDIAQETFVKLYERGAMPDNLRGWLVSVAHNLMRDEHRRSARRLRLLRGRPAEYTLGDPPPAPDDAVLGNERRTAVRHALNTLAERDRRLLLLRHEGYSYRELATSTGVAEASVGTLLARATAAFKLAMEDSDDAPV